MKTTCLIVVDIQHDFLPGGALAVPKGDEVIPVARKLIEKKLTDGWNYVVATQDWHPANHGSFAANNPGVNPYDTFDLDGLPQVAWPVHCVQNTHGAFYSDGIQVAAFDKVFQKGTNPKIDSYSGFFDNGKRNSTGLSLWLKDRKVTDCYILGLATDYCVKFTAIDSIRVGFKTHLIEDGCRAVNLKPTDGADAIEEMRRHGILIENSGSYT